MEQIIDKRIDGQTVCYFVKRKAALGDIRAWESENQLDCPDLIRKFEPRISEKNEKRERLIVKMLMKSLVKRVINALEVRSFHVFLVPQILLLIQIVLFVDLRW